MGLDGMTDAWPISPGLAVRPVRWKRESGSGRGKGSGVQGILIGLVEKIVRAERSSERVGILERKAEMTVAAPALGMSERARHPADFERQCVHGAHIIPHSLGAIQPVPLAGVRRESLPFRFVKGARIDKRSGDDAAAEGVAEAMWHGVVDRDLSVHGLAGRMGAEVWNPPGEGRGHRKTRGVLVIFHVVFRGMGEDDARIHLTDHGGQPAQQIDVVENLKVAARGTVELGAEQTGSGPGLLVADLRSLLGGENSATTIAARERHIVSLPTGFPQPQKRARSQKLDVIGVSEDGEGTVWHRLYSRRRIPLESSFVGQKPKNAETEPMVEIRMEYQGNLRVQATHGPSGAMVCTDAPVDNQGRGESFSPTDLVATALGSCVLTVMGIYAERHGIDLRGTAIRVGKIMSASPPRRIARLEITLECPSDPGLRHTQALETAAHACPVHQSLNPEIEKPMRFVWGERITEAQ